MLALSLKETSGDTAVVYIIGNFKKLQSYHPINVCILEYLTVSGTPQLL